MKKRTHFKFKSKLGLLLIPALLLAVLLVPATDTQAHCDSVDGPVVTAAQKAIETGNVNYVLPYVTADGEAEIVAAFNKAMLAQDKSDEVRDTINYWFYETVVRVHRQGEGADYTGLKPAGIDYGPALPAAEEALVANSTEELNELILTSIEEEIDKRFAEVMELQNASIDDVEAQRERAEAELLFEKYIYQIYTDATAELSHEGHGNAGDGADAQPVTEGHSH